MSSKLEAFLASRRSPETAKSYRKAIRSFTLEPDYFLKVALEDPRRAESMLIDYFSKATVSGTTKRDWYHGIKSFLVFNDAELKWSKISGVIPVARKVALDRAPTKEEIRTLLDFCDLKGRMIVLCMGSGGFRIGAWNYLNIGDVHFMQTGIARLRVYRGEPEEYFTFVSAEAAESIRDYLEQRKRLGEEVTSDSPLAIGKWGFYEGRPDRAKNRKAVRLTSTAISHLLYRTWRECGTRTDKRKRHEFKQAHGFRKFFKTNLPVCPIHGDLDKEVLLGHFLSYHKPSIEHLAEYYAKYCGALALTKAEAVKAEMEETKDELRKEIGDLKEQLKSESLDKLKLKDQVRDAIEWIEQEKKKRQPPERIRE